MEREAIAVAWRCNRPNGLLGTERAGARSCMRRALRQPDAVDGRHPAQRAKAREAPPGTCFRQVKGTKA